MSLLKETVENVRRYRPKQVILLPDDFENLIAFVKADDLWYSSDPATEPEAWYQKVKARKALGDL